MVMREYFVRILSDVPILSDNFSPSFLEAISLKMKEKRLGPGEKILTKNTTLPILQFITKGNIEYSMDEAGHHNKICSVNVIQQTNNNQIFR